MKHEGMGGQFFFIDSLTAASNVTYWGALGMF